MKKALFSLTLLPLALSAFAQTALYGAGRSLADQSISVKAWGSGLITETNETAFEGATSIRISTRNFFQGGRILFAKPISVETAFADPNNLLMFAVRMPDSEGGSGGAGKGGPGGGRGGPGGGLGGPGVGGPGGAAGGRGGSGAGAGGGQAAATITPSTLRNIRMVITTSDDKRSEVYVAVNTSASSQQWRQIALPLKGIRGFENTNKTIKEIAISGDATATFWIGEIKMINDSTPLQLDLNTNELNLALGDEVELVANGFGGASVLEYTWDFDDADGVQVEAEGQAIKRRFRKAGTFNVTCTVHDLFRLKKSVSSVIKVKINP